MKKLKYIYLTYIFWIFTNCGGQNNSSITQNPTNTIPSNPTQTIPGATQNAPGEAPPLFYSFTLEGKKPDFTTPEFLTDSILKVKVVAGGSDGLRIYESSTKTTQSNADVSYGCVQYRVELEGRSASLLTPILKVDGLNNQNCSQAQSSVVLDFSSHLNTIGNQAIKIKISDARTDSRCQLWNNTANGRSDFYATRCAYNRIPPLDCALYYLGARTSFCPIKPLYTYMPKSSHTATGSIEIQINGTSLVK